jgi:AcrR family transcriptional regulator
MKQQVKRRLPTQDRAQRTQLLIFEAALKLLELEGLENFNTNRLAELSGFSVGTIYQYFEDKHAILSALAQHEQQRAMQEVRRLLLSDLAELPSDDRSPRVRAVVRAILHTFGSRHRAHKVLLDIALQGADHDDPEGAALTPLATLLTSGAIASRSGVTLTLSETDAFVLTQAVMGPIRSALLRNVRLFRKPQFEDSLVDLIDAFVRRRSGEIRQ